MLLMLGGAPAPTPAIVALLIEELFKFEGGPTPPPMFEVEAIYYMKRMFGLELCEYWLEDEAFMSCDPLLAEAT